MIASWKRHAIDGTGVTFIVAGDVAKAASESEVEKLHAKIGQLLVEWDSFAEPSVDERGPEASDGRTCLPRPIDLDAMSPATDLPLVLLLFAGPGDGRDAALMTVIVECLWVWQQHLTSALGHDRATPAEVYQRIGQTNHGGACPP